MLQVPILLQLSFVITTLLTLLLIVKAFNFNWRIILILILWLALNSYLSLISFYTNLTSIPPRFVLLVLPPLAIIILLFTTSKGRTLIDTLDNKTLTLLHIVRIPVELVLLGLYVYKAIPLLMTFEGRNFDIISGITAPVMYLLYYKYKSVNSKILLFWNIVCLVLLLNIVINAVLSAPFPFQQFAFDQPNIAVLYFPFCLLPGFIVPVVLFSHLVSIRQIISNIT